MCVKFYAVKTENDFVSAAVTVLNFVKASSFTLSDIITYCNVCCVSACFQPVMFKPQCILLLHYSPSNGNILNVFGIVLGTFPTVYWFNVRSLLELRVTTVGLNRSLAAQFLMTKAEKKRKRHLTFLVQTFLLPSRHKNSLSSLNRWEFPENRISAGKWQYNDNAWLWSIAAVLKICPCAFRSGGGEVGPWRRLRLPLREAASDCPELHTAAHPHPALHLRGRRLERLLLVHRARSRQSWGTPGPPLQKHSAEEAHTTVAQSASMISLPSQRTWWWTPSFLLKKRALTWSRISSVDVPSVSMLTS